jgi:ATP/maltotriose-dependent transcriptional regulator MalT
MLVDTVRMHHRLVQLPAMRAALEEAEAGYARLGGPPPPGQMTDPGLWRTLVTLIDGDYAEAGRLAAEGIQRNTANDRPGNLPFTWWMRAGAALWQEDTDAAAEYALHCGEAAFAAGDRWELAYCHNMQGHVAVARGHYAAARQHYQAGFAIREEFDDPEGMGTGLGHLAKVAALQGVLDEAEQLYRTSLAIARGIGDQITTANALNGLGQLACVAGDYVTAGRHFAEGLSLMAEAQMMRLMLTFVVSAGDWLLLTGRPAEAVRMLALAHAHPASDRDTRARAQQLLATVALPPEVYAAAIERGRDADPCAVKDDLVHMLTAPTVHPDQVTPGSPPLPAPPAMAAASLLAEPLTERELAVLRLIAAGHSNREIADELFLSVKTVQSYNQQIYGKLGVGSRTQAVARARDLGLIA